MFYFWCFCTFFHNLNINVFLLTTLRAQYVFVMRFKVTCLLISTRTFQALQTISVTFYFSASLCYILCVIKFWCTHNDKKFLRL